MFRTLAIASLATLLAGSALAAPPLVDAAWLKANLDNVDVVVLDLREPAKEGDDNPHAAGRIPDSVHAPYAASGWRTKIGDVPGMLPSEAAIEALLGRLGVEEDDHVVIVSDGKTSSDFGAAARVYWTLKVMGHEAKSVLEGGHAGWVAAGGDLESGPADAAAPTIYDATYDPALVATLDDVKAAQAAGVTLVDARPVDQYTGKVTPDNVGIAGTIGGAVSLPHTVLVRNGNDVIDGASLASYRSEVGIAGEGDHIAFCNTGHWASVG
ncbi:MAG TPA: rhodanese-like domain-containing protein, partial [Methylomirabilota bacterium]|nr:rhodanese-like domain-containing protein [Methylomirabilota bacterium]